MQGDAYWISKWIKTQEKARDLGLEIRVERGRFLIHDREFNSVRSLYAFVDGYELCANRLEAGRD